MAGRQEAPAVTVGIPGAGWVRMSLHPPAAIPAANAGSPGRHCHCGHGAAPCPICCCRHAGRAQQGPRHLARTPSRRGRTWAVGAWLSHPLGDRREEKLWHEHLRRHRPASRENRKVLLKDQGGRSGLSGASTFHFAGESRTCRRSDEDAHTHLPLQFRPDATAGSRAQALCVQ